MENLGILVHNRSGVKKNQRDQRQSSLEYRCVSELKMDDADYKVLFLLYSVLCFHFKGGAGLVISAPDHHFEQCYDGE